MTLLVSDFIATMFTNLSLGFSFNDAALHANRGKMPTMDDIAARMLKENCWNKGGIATHTVLRAMLEEGDDITARIESSKNCGVWKSLEFFTMAKDVLLNGKNHPLSPDSFLTLVMNLWKDMSSNTDHEIPQRIALLKTAIEAGADINAHLENSHVTSQKVGDVTAIKEAFLQGENPILDPDNFLKLIMQIYAPNVDIISQEIALIQTAMEAGANIEPYINTHTIMQSLQLVRAAKDVLLSAENSVLSPETFLKLVMNARIYDASEKIALLQTAIEAGADIKPYVEDNHVDWDLLSLHKAKDALLDKEQSLIAPDSCLTLIAENIKNDEETGNYAHISKEEIYPDV